MSKLYLIHSSTSNNELYHYGIKGQKWGVRRFQYEDGSLTPAGRDRYGIGELKRKADKAVKTTKKKVKKGINTTKKKVIKGINKYREKIEKENKQLDTAARRVSKSAFSRNVLMFDVYSGARKERRRWAKGGLATAINLAANIYISRNGAKHYYVAKGVDVLRKAAIFKMSVDEIHDTINDYRLANKTIKYYAEDKKGDANG